VTLTTSARLLIAAAMFFGGAAYTARASVSEPVPIRESLVTFPTQVGHWQGVQVTPLPSNVLAVLGVDEYLNRTYYTSERALGLYVGYYQSQRQGDAIHSPLNCLPGAGWEPLKRDYRTLNVALSPGNGSAPAPTQPIRVNRYLIRKGADTQVVLYWYQSHGRAVANEYLSKVYMVYDAMRSNRTDAALVRVVAPVVGSGHTAEQEAEGRAAEFVQLIYPFLGRYLPS
jgi:EpsI family protein